jgi:hypothetical protein
MKKLLAEGTPAESFVILGWKIDTRRGLVSLPEHKFLAWDAELQDVIKSSSKPIKLKQLERVQGRDVNVATIVHGASHFLNQTYQAIARAREHRFARFTADEILDLHMKRHFLRAAFNGVDINAMTLREPDHMGRSDAFEGGIGGFDICSGRAWRLQIPSELIHRRSQNLLEFLACIVQLVLLVKESSWQRSDCFLSVGDNTSALRWLESRILRRTITSQSIQLWLAKRLCSCSTVALRTSRSGYQGKTTWWRTLFLVVTTSLITN